MSIIAYFFPPNIGDEKEEMGKQRSLFMKVNWQNEKKNIINATANYEENSDLTGGGSTVYCSRSEVVYSKVITNKGSSTIKNNTYKFDNKNLDAVSLDVNPNAPNFVNGHWSCSIHEDQTRQQRFYISGVTVADNGVNHNVFDRLEFRDVFVEFKFSDNDANSILINLDETTPFHIERSAGILGTTDDNDDKESPAYQAGIAQDMYYYFKSGDLLFRIVVQFSFVFRYPKNDFEPGGTIAASKIYPQITFQGECYNMGDYPTVIQFPQSMVLQSSGMNPNSAYIAGYKGRVKMDVNVNSDHHVSEQVVDGVTYDGNYLGALRSQYPDAIPPLFEKILKPDYFTANNNTRNLLGFFVDSNLDNIGDTLRLRPPYASPFLVGCPFWFNVFDYAHYDVQNSVDMVGVHGMQTSNLSKFSNGKFLSNPFPVDATYPFDYLVHNPTDPSSDGKPLIYEGIKLERQGEFDNIHLHGYLGHYKDNDQLVIHAPVCAFCCFHLHWRWSAFNVKVSSNIFLRRLKQFDNSLSFQGWDRTRSNKTPGAPLIPENQHLKIAATPPDYVPFNKTDTVLEPGATVPLIPDKKAIWYCVDIINTSSDMSDVGGSSKSHVILEQGCGYAFGYSDFAENIVTKTLVGPPVLQDYFKVTMRNMGYDEIIWQQFYSAITDDVNPMAGRVLARFEMQYKLMHFFNRAVLNPNNWNATIKAQYPEDFMVVDIYENGFNDDRTMITYDQVPTFRTDETLVNILKNL